MGLNLHGKVSLDGSGFEAGIRRLSHVGREGFNELKNFAAASFGAYGIETMFHKSIENAKELVNTAKRLGTDVEWAQVFKEAAESASTDLDAIAKAFEKINVARAKALKGDSGSLAAFMALGIDPKQATQDMALGRLHQLAGGTNAAILGPMLRDLGIKDFGRFINFLQTDFEAMRESMEHLGVIMDTQTAIKLKALGHEFELLSKILITNVGPALLEFAKGLTKTVTKSLGGIAGGAAFLGGATAHWTTARDWVKGLGFGPAMGDFTPIEKPFNAKAGTEAAVQAITPYSDFLKKMAEMEERMKKEAEGMKNQPPPDFTEAFHAAKKEPKGRRIDSADNLVRVGNFLGDSQSSLVNVAERHLQETKAMHSTLKSMRGGLSKNSTSEDPSFA